MQLLQSTSVQQEQLTTKVNFSNSIFNHKLFLHALVAMTSTEPQSGIRCAAHKALQGVAITTTEILPLLAISCSKNTNTNQDTTESSYRYRSCSQTGLQQSGKTHIILFQIHILLFFVHWWTKNGTIRYRIVLCIPFDQSLQLSSWYCLYGWIGKRALTWISKGSKPGVVDLEAFILYSRLSINWTTATTVAYNPQRSL